MPVHIYRAKYTLPNLPSPNRRIILKFYLQSPYFPVLGFDEGLFWFLRKEGKVRSDL